MRIRAIRTDAVAHRQLKPSQQDVQCSNGSFASHAGAVDEFSTHGHLISRIASGKLNAPWGLATAPSGRGRVAGTLPVGNFGDSRINIIAKHRHHYSPQEDQ